MKLMTRSTCPLGFLSRTPESTPGREPSAHLGVTNLTSLRRRPPLHATHHPHPTGRPPHQPHLASHGTHSMAYNFLRLLPTALRVRSCTWPGLEPSVVPLPVKIRATSLPTHPRHFLVSSDCPSSLSPPTALPGSDGEPVRQELSVPSAPPRHTSLRTSNSILLENPLPRLLGLAFLQPSKAFSNPPSLPLSCSSQPAGKFSLLRVPMRSRKPSPSYLPPVRSFIQLTLASPATPGSLSVGS